MKVVVFQNIEQKILERGVQQVWEFFKITEPKGVVYRVKRGGPSTEPWGTPQEKAEKTEMESLIETA